MTTGNTDIPPELRPIAEMLCARRPEPTPLELDSTKRRVLANSRRRGSFMRSRVAIVAMLVLGLLSGTTGAGLAVNGLAGGDQASTAQYGTATPTTGSTGKAKRAKDKETDKVLPAEADKAPVQRGRQVRGAQESSGLPLSSYAAIPLLLLGFVLVRGGMMMRRSGAGS
jgi:hypothetical protein